MSKKYFIYILTNRHNTVLYTGVTSDLLNRITQHKEKMAKGFTKKYNIDKLAYYEFFDDAYEAIQREKQIKGGSRKKKILLIESMNASWKNVSDEL